MSDHWYRCEIDRELLKSLSRRTNWHGLVYLLYFVVLLVLYFSLGGSSAEPERIVLTRG